MASTSLVMGVEVTNRQRFHMFKHFGTELIQHPLRINSSELVADGGDGETAEIQRTQNQYKMKNLRAGCLPVPSVCPCLLQNGNNVLLEDGRESADHSTDQNQHDDNRQECRVQAEQHFDQPRESPTVFLHVSWFQAVASFPATSSIASCP